MPFKDLLIISDFHFENILWWYNSLTVHNQSFMIALSIRFSPLKNFVEKDLSYPKIKNGEMTCGSRPPLSCVPHVAPRFT